MAEKLKVFISYNHKSKDEANVFRTLLRKLGFNCWFDEDKIEYGKDIKQMMTAGVIECDVMILLITKDYINSENCLYEANLAALSNKETIPVLLEKIKWPIVQLGDKYGPFKSYASLYKTINKNIDNKKDKYRNIKHQLLKNDVLKKIFNQLRDRASNEGKEASKCFQFCWDLELTNECCYESTEKLKLCCDSSKTCCIDCCNHSREHCNDCCYESTEKLKLCCDSSKTSCIDCCNNSRERCNNCCINSKEHCNDCCYEASEKCSTLYWKTYKFYIILDIVVLTFRLCIEIAALAIGSVITCSEQMVINYLYTGPTFGFISIIIIIFMHIIGSHKYKTKDTFLYGGTVMLVFQLYMIFVNIAGSSIIGVHLSTCTGSLAKFLIAYIIFQWIFMCIHATTGIIQMYCLKINDEDE